MNRKPLRIDILTIFPEMIEPYVTGSILGRAQKKKLVDIRAHDLRKWTNDRHHTVDDRPFGGGPGMVMKVEPFDRALKALRKEKRKKKNDPKKKIRIILTSAKGKIFTQADARRLSKYDRLVFLCGRYEGVDERVAEHLADEELSIGEYVMTGGELAALVMSDAIARLRPGVLGKQESLAMESHTIKGVLEYPQYTRPELYSPPAGGGVRGGGSKTKKVTWRVPKILLSGDHKKIEAWQRAFLIPRTF
ncbi:MAG: tRNA (guanosine(37)-N1)-methyltransferase TrmD [Candidatus Uhrbacteria bacterium]|nr:tRNA (guanosine(37)-N1)-methyltransferase TrmD [Candidatus Uhrbacteria bacterium]